METIKTCSSCNKQLTAEEIKKNTEPIGNTCWCTECDDKYEEMTRPGSE